MVVPDEQKQPLEEELVLLPLLEEEPELVVELPLEEELEDATPEEPQLIIALSC